MEHVRRDTATLVNVLSNESLRWTLSARSRRKLTLATLEYHHLDGYARPKGATDNMLHGWALEHFLRDAKKRRARAITMTHVHFVARSKMFLSQMHGALDSLNYRRAAGMQCPVII